MLHRKPRSRFWMVTCGMGLAAVLLFLGGARDSSGQGAAGSLPDSVLAVVDGDRQVTVSMFRRAWAQVDPPARPDSLTPESGRRFLDLLLGKEALGAMALTEAWDWSRKDSVEYGGLRDRLVMKVVLDSALQEAQNIAHARGDDSLTVGEIGTLARDLNVDGMGITYDEALLERVAQAFAALPKPPRDSGLYVALRALGRNPEVDEADLPKVIARWEGNTFKVGDLMAYWTTLNPIARPRVEIASQVRDLVNNGIFERELRRSAQARGIEFWPDIAEELFRQREYIAVQHLVDREVYARIQLDSLTLRRYYRENERAWELPPRVRLLRLELPDRAQAETMAVRLHDGTQVKTLRTEAEKAGVSYEAEYTAAMDTLIFDTGMKLGVGGVFGPDSTDDGWAVSRVTAILPGRPRPYSEVVELVQHAVYGNKGEELMQELLDRSRKAVPIQRNERALERLVRAGLDGA